SSPIQTHHPRIPTPEPMRKRIPLSACCNIYSQIITTIAKLSRSMKNRHSARELGSTTSQTAAMLRAPELDCSMLPKAPGRPTFPSRRPTEKRRLLSRPSWTETPLYGTIELGPAKAGASAGTAGWGSEEGQSSNWSDSVGSIMGGRRRREPWDYECEIW
ncbi:hypothetical protein P154DRAFT_525297, partial [Amniculicola lignicola CBS 123094]